MNDFREKKVGIYGVNNTTKDMWYIGSSKDIDQRLDNHRNSIKRKTGIFGGVEDGDDFEFEILKILPSPKYFELWENYYIGYYDSLCSGYNKVLSSRRPEISIKNYNIGSKEIQIMNDSDLMELLKLEDESQLLELKYIVPYMRITENINRYEKGEVLNFLLTEGTISAYLEKADIETLSLAKEETARNKTQSDKEK